MAHRGGTVPGLDIADRQFPGARAFDEIPHVVLALVESDRVGWQGGLQQFRAAGPDLVAADPDPAVGALKADAVGLPLRVGMRPVDGVVLGGVDLQADAVGISVVHLVFGEGVVAAGNGLGEVLRLDLGGGEQADGPIGDVVVVSAPVGHGAAGIFIPETEISVAALFHIVMGGGLALPEIPIQAGGHRGGLERTVAQARGQPDAGLLEFADAIVAH